MFEMRGVSRGGGPPPPKKKNYVQRTLAFMVSLCSLIWLRWAHRRMRRGGGGRGAAALPNSGKTVGKIRAKQEEKIGQRKLKD